MTLDEAIKQEKEITKQYEHLVVKYQSLKDYGNPKSSITDCAKSCKVCAEEHRQLAEWLKDYKRLLEQKPCDDAVSRILQRMWNCRGKHTTSIDKVKMEQIIRDELPPVTQKPIECDDVISRDCEECEIGNPCLYCEHEFKDKRIEQMCKDCTHAGLYGVNSIKCTLRDEIVLSDGRCNGFESQESEDME